MKQKIFILALSVVFLIGLVAAGTLTNVSSSLAIPNFIAGGTTSTIFSFEYPDVHGNYNNAPLVARVNITGVNGTPSVWKGDFHLFMYTKQYVLPGFFHYNTIPMTCSETAPINFKAKDKPDIQYTINNILNGTFYCYNPNYYILQLDSKDKVNLNITSNPALYPGNYSVSVELMEMEPDTTPPNINLILNNTLFNENQTIPIKLNVTDMYPIKYVQYEIRNPDLFSNYTSSWINISLNENSGLYENNFNFTKYNLNSSGSYWIFARACDVVGNCGEM